MSRDAVRKKELKVFVRMHDGSLLLGSFYLSDNERMQDVINDSREFLPLHAINDAGLRHIVMLSKRYMQQVEEVHPEIHEDALAQAKAAPADSPEKEEPLSLDDTPNPPAPHQA